MGNFSIIFLKKYQAILLKFPNQYNRLLNVIEKNSLKSYGLYFPLGINEFHKNMICHLLEKNHIEEKKNNICVVIGAKSEQSRWDIKNFIELIGYLELKGYNTILVGGKEELNQSKYIRTSEKVYNFVGKLEPLETAELFKHCILTISADTGPMHLSYAVGTKVIGIFSSFNYPGKWDPPPPNIVIKSDILFCDKCFQKTCKATNKCINLITTKKVIEIFESTINSSINC